MPLKEKDYTNDEGLKDGSLLDNYKKYENYTLDEIYEELGMLDAIEANEIPVFCGKKAGKNHQHTKRCMQ